MHCELEQDYKALKEKNIVKDFYVNFFSHVPLISARFGQISQTPIYAWTANNSEEDVRRCFEAGMEGHLPKPATKLDILKVISSL